MFYEMFVYCRSRTYYEYRAEILYVCPGPCFGDACRVSACSFPYVLFLALYIVKILFWENSRDVVKHPSGVHIFTNTRVFFRGGGLLEECLVMFDYLVSHDQPVCRKHFVESILVVVMLTPDLFNKMKAIYLSLYVMYVSNNYMSQISPSWVSDSKCDCIYVYVLYKYKKRVLIWIWNNGTIMVMTRCPIS